MAKRHFVSGDQHYGITGQLLEIQRQLRTKGGSPLDPERVKTALQEVIEPGHKEGIGLYEFPLGNDALDSVLACVRASGYLDTSFDSREVHPLIMRPLTKKQVLDEYRESGGRIWIPDEQVYYMPYVMPEPRELNVLILNLGRDIGDDEALVEMAKLDVRPLVFEEIIQYGIKYPKHQERKMLVGLRSNHVLGSNDECRFLATRALGVNLHAPSMWSRFLSAVGLGGGYRFLVVPK